MESRIQTTLLLVLGTITAFLGWFFIYPADESGAVEDAAAIMADPNLAKIGILMGFGGMIAAFIGLVNMTRSMAMAGGAGSPYANIAAVLLVAMIAVMLVATGLELGTAEATSAAGGATLMGISLALGGGLQLALGVGLIFLGLGIVLNKNLHIIGGAVPVIAGVAMLIAAFVDLEAFELIAWLGFMVGNLVLGGLTFKSNK